MSTFNSSLRVSLMALALATTTGAQTPLVFVGAELGVPFGAVKGQLAVAARQVIFVSTDDDKWSVLIERADVADVRLSDGVVSITTKRPLRDASGERDTFRFRLDQPATLLQWYQTAATPADAEGKGQVLSSYQVVHDHRIGNCRGTLILTDTTVVYESNTKLDDSRQWKLIDIKEVAQNGAYKLRIDPFIGDGYNFELTGKGIDSGEYRSLVDRIARARGGR